VPGRRTPSFEDFTRWVAALGKTAAVDRPPEAVLAEARMARDEMLRQQPAPVSQGRREVLELLAAATEDAGLPPELTTARGFRVSIVYGDGPRDETASLCVLVQCPPELAPALVGRSTFLWSGEQRFELGEFDADGKAIGKLPAGLEITATDLRDGAVCLESPDSPGDD